MVIELSKTLALGLFVEEPGFDTVKMCCLIL